MKCELIASIKLIMKGNMSICELIIKLSLLMNVSFYPHEHKGKHHCTNYPYDHDGVIQAER